VLVHPVAQVTNNYGSGYLHRPDMAMLVYGFVPGREPPVMSTCDLPEGFGDVRHPQQAYPVTPTLEPDYGEGLRVHVGACSAAALRCSNAGCTVFLRQPARWDAVCASSANMGRDPAARPSMQGAQPSTRRQSDVTTRLCADRQRRGQLDDGGRAAAAGGNLRRAADNAGAGPGPAG
jgi:hypothetical protein